MNKTAKDHHGRDENRMNRTFVWIVILVFLTLELFVFTWSRVQCTTVGYALTHEQDVHNKLVSFKKELIIERAHLRSPDRIAALAQERMGLNIPEQNQILTLR
jgi:cell division protein FtsL